MKSTKKNKSLSNFSFFKKLMKILTRCFCNLWGNIQIRLKFWYIESLFILSLLRKVEEKTFITSFETGIMSPSRWMVPYFKKITISFICIFEKNCQNFICEVINDGNYHNTFGSFWSHKKGTLKGTYFVASEAAKSI